MDGDFVALRQLAKIFSQVDTFSLVIFAGIIFVFMGRHFARKFFDFLRGVNI
jgi:hypothetical protein